MNNTETQIHKVSLFINYIQVKDKLFLAYKFIDHTLGVFDEIRTKCVSNIPIDQADKIALYLSLVDLKKSTDLTIYQKVTNNSQCKFVKNNSSIIET